MNGTPWSESEIAVLREQYTHVATAKLAVQLGRSVDQLYRKAWKLGLKKTDEFLNSEECGRMRKGKVPVGSVAHRFKKGQTPPNKGVRRPGWAPGRMRDTQFKPGVRQGQAAKNWVPIGTIKADSEGYLRIKVREHEHGKEASGFGNTKVWPLYGRYLWEEANGPIPTNHIIAFKDGDRSNVVLGNLELVSRVENCRRNSLWTRLPRELATAITMLGALKRKVRAIESGKKQNV